MPDRPDCRWPTRSLRVEFRPTHGGSFRAITVTPAQWRGEVCVLRRGCSGPLQHVGYLYNLGAAPGTIEYSRGAVAHVDCLRPVERGVPTHSRCQPNATAAAG